MSNKCEILNDDEIEKYENNSTLFNFRRFDAAELERRSSPFDKTQKKEFPFLFQKRKPRHIEERKISLDELTHKLDAINVENNNIENTIHITEEYESHTPPYPPFMNDDLKTNDTKEEDGTK